MALHFYDDGRPMFTCKICNKHIDIVNDSGSSIDACKEHVGLVESMKEKEKEEKREYWHKKYNEVRDSVPACPYCFKSDYDWYECFRDEDGYDTEVECCHCGQTYSATLHKEYSFTTKRKDNNE